MWKLPDGRVIRTPKDVVINDIQYSSQIFRRWSKSELNAIGIFPFREERFDQKWFRSTGSTDTVTGGEVVRTHTTTKKLTTVEAQDLRIMELKAQYISEKRRAVEFEDFYKAVGDNVTRKVWSDYLLALQKDARDLRTLVKNAGTYDQIKDLKFAWTAAPDTGTAPQ